MKLKLKSINNFSLLFEELDTLHFAAFGYQSGEFFSDWIHSFRVQKISLSIVVMELME